MASSDLYSPDLSAIDNATDDIDGGSAAPPTDDSGPSTNCSVVPTSPRWGRADYDAATAAVCGMYLVFGVMCAFFGYRCFKAVMFFTGFIFASIVVYLICLEEAILPVWSNALIALSAGILFGLITLLVQYVGLFMLGFHSGLLLSVVGLCAGEALDVAVPPSPWASVGIMLLSGLVMALTNLCFQKSLTIFGSALYGGAVVSTCLDYFLQDSVVLLWVWDRVSLQHQVRECWLTWVSWLILAAWPAVFVIGIVTQIACTGKGIYHEQQFSSSAASSGANSRSSRHHGRGGRGQKQETREERKQRKFRYLYQVRTCHGDVISQPIPRKYVQQVNETYSA